MGALARFLQLVGLNAVPVAGILFGGWSPATALALYWCENVVGAALVAARIAVHREATGKRGHYRPHFGLKISSTLKVAGQRKPIDTTPKTLLAEFTWIAVVFSIAHAIFLWVVVVLAMEIQIDRGELGQGLVAMVGLQLVGFAWDWRSLDARPFAWIKTLAERSIGRVMLVHVAILGGMLLSASRPNPERFFLAFGALKLIADLAGSLPLALPPPDPERPPAFARLGGARFAEHWRQAAAEERAKNAEDELERKKRS
jgi:hypothetical protein